MRVELSGSGSVGVDSYAKTCRSQAARELPDLASLRRWSRGRVDLSDLAGRGVFEAWKDPAFFRSVRIAAHGAVEWGSELNLCPDALYMRLTGKSPEELFSTLRSIQTNA